jgi:hypothetical protein
MIATGTEKVHRTDLPGITGPKRATSDGYPTESDSGVARSVSEMGPREELGERKRSARRRLNIVRCEQ